MRWLAAAILGVAAVATAQTLDLRVKPESEGVITALRTVDAGTTAIAPRAPTPGSPSDLSPGVPVGAVVALPIGRDVDRTVRFGAAGAAGTAEMQPYLDKTAQEVVVTMDDGEKRVFRPRDVSRFHVGQRVSVQAGELVARGR